ncbi:hypothetical protein HYPSUDRAFT_762416 [Hypholoma sublateritium FD-334 SS-4]|uniref:Secreted protein n=1 Tax=Hypholoma sublateritium (strain FD-334 SS-4) TaxID=945553 RepID=A0A0D2NXD2_HYPSF|nr:hypothetical protein HYPSUDRAFT_762416 [Hypholoma sublateritium FD-334 SS-4]
MLPLRRMSVRSALMCADLVVCADAAEGMNPLCRHYPYATKAPRTGIYRGPFETHQQHHAEGAAYFATVLPSSPTMNARRSTRIFIGATPNNSVADTEDDDMSRIKFLAGDPGKNDLLQRRNREPRNESPCKLQAR